MATRKRIKLQPQQTDPVILQNSCRVLLQLQILWTFLIYVLEEFHGEEDLAHNHTAGKRYEES